MGSIQARKPLRPARKPRRGRPSTPFMRERILRGAAALFAERPYDAVSVDDVAGFAGVGKGSVYRQFGSKEELYAAAVIDGFAQVQAQIRAALPHCESARERIATVVRQALDFFWNRRQFFTLMRDPRALGPRRSQQYRAHRQELSRLVTAILDDGIRTGEIARGLETRVAAEALLGMLRGINRYSRDYTDPARAAASLTALFFDGCAARRRA